jgi:glycosyltransferase involved in cell wall biosynthesis
LLPDINCINIKENKSSLYYFLSRAQRVFQRITKINISRNLERIFGHSFTFYNDSKSIAKSISQHYNNHDLIITLSQGASFRPHHALLSLPELYNKWLAYVHDPYPFHLYPKPYNWVEAGYKQKEQFFRIVSESAKYSAFPSQLLKEWMGQFFPKFLDTGLIIPHQQLKINVLQNLGEYNSLLNEDTFTILHAGNLMKQRPPLPLINAYKKFLEANPKAKQNSRLLLIGPASYHKKMLEKESTLLPQLKLHLKSVPFDIVNTLQHKVSVNIILESDAEISPFLPGKFPHCVYANRPILALSPNKSEVRRLLGVDYPFISVTSDENAISENIELLYSNWQSYNNQKLKNKELLEYLSTEYVKSTLEKILYN